MGVGAIVAFAFYAISSMIIFNVITSMVLLCMKRPWIECFLVTMSSALIMGGMFVL